MLVYEEVPKQNRVNYTIDGWISSNDYNIAMKRLKNLIISNNSPLLIYEEIRSFSGMPPHLLIDDIFFRLRHRGAFAKVAIVTDLPWLVRLISFYTFFEPKKVRHFSMNKKQDAENWLSL